jgi:hypothetical protein
MIETAKRNAYVDPGEMAVAVGKGVQLRLLAVPEDSQA